MTSLRDLLAGDVVDAARGLLGHVLERDEPDGTTTRVLLVETEAYGPDDPASHAARGPTAANASMFAAPGTTYVYFTYGMHHCVNVAVGPEGHGAAVLLRAAAVLDGAAMVDVRREGRARPLAGPARLAQGLDVDRGLDGVDLLDATSPLRLVPGPGRAHEVAAGPRVGVRLAADVPWRFWVADHPEVSAYRRHPRADG